MLYHISYIIYYVIIYYILYIIYYVLYIIYYILYIIYIIYIIHIIYYILNAKEVVDEKNATECCTDFQPLSKLPLAAGAGTETATAALGDDGQDTFGAVDPMIVKPQQPRKKIGAQVPGL